MDSVVSYGKGPALKSKARHELLKFEEGHLSRAATEQRAIQRTEGKGWAPQDASLRGGLASSQRPDSRLGVWTTRIHWRVLSKGQTWLEVGFGRVDLAAWDEWIEMEKLKAA